MAIAVACLVRRAAMRARDRGIDRGASTLLCVHERRARDEQPQDGYCRPPAVRNACSVHRPVSCGAIPSSVHQKSFSTVNAHSRGGLATPVRPNGAVFVTAPFVALTVISGEYCCQ